MLCASAPGKCILFGEHAVVYGQPAIAIAISERMTVCIEKSDEWRIDGLKFKPQKHPHIESLRQRIWKGGPPLDIRVSGEIPPGSGLGSSAALSVAAAMVLRAAKGRFNIDGSWQEGFRSDWINGAYGGSITEIRNGKLTIGEGAISLDEAALLGHAVEANAQGGRASPIDSSTASHGGCIALFEKRNDDLQYLYSRKLSTPEGDRNWQIHTIDIHDDIKELSLVIGQTGIHSPTSEQVAKVAAVLEAEPERMIEIETIGAIARRGINALISGDAEAVGRAMSENHLLLRGLGVSSPELENLVTAALPSSLGVKMTGAGGGGCMIALTRDPKRTSEDIELAGGRSIICGFDSPGGRLESQLENPLWVRR